MQYDENAEVKMFLHMYNKQVKYSIKITFILAIKMEGIFFDKSGIMQKFLWEKL